MKFILTETIKEFTHIKDEYGYVEVKKVYECNSFDDLQNIFLTLVDFSKDKLNFEIEKVEGEEE